MRDEIYEEWADGATLTEIAESRGMSVEGVRSHVSKRRREVHFGPHLPNRWGGWDGKTPTWWGIHLSIRAINALRHEGIETDQQLINFMAKNENPRAKLLRVPNVGRKTVSEIIKYVKHIIHNPDDVAWQGKRVN